MSADCAKRRGCMPVKEKRESMETQLLLIVGMLVVFYVLVIRPQQKRAAAQRAMIAAIQAGDEIVTVGGIFATVIEAGERIRVSTVDGSELEIAPQAVGQVLPKETEEPETDDEPEA